MSWTCTQCAHGLQPNLCLHCCCREFQEGAPSERSAIAPANPVMTDCRNLPGDGVLSGVRRPDRADRLGTGEEETEGAEMKDRILSALGDRIVVAIRMAIPANRGKEGVEMNKVYQREALEHLIAKALAWQAQRGQAGPLLVSEAWSNCVANKCDMFWLEDARCFLRAIEAVSDTQARQLTNKRRPKLAKRKACK